MFQPDVAGTYSVRVTVHDGCTQMTTDLTIVAACAAAPVVILSPGPVLSAPIDGVTGLQRDVVASPPGPLWQGPANTSMWALRYRAVVLNASASRLVVPTGKVGLWAVLR